MNITLLKKDICGKVRYSCQCPNCGKVILIDSEVFNKDNSYINCYHCREEYVVLAISGKHHLILNIEKNE